MASLGNQALVPAVSLPAAPGVVVLWWAPTGYEVFPDFGVTTKGSWGEAHSGWLDAGKSGGIQPTSQEGMEVTRREHLSWLCPSYGWGKGCSFPCG